MKKLLILVFLILTFCASARADTITISSFSPGMDWRYGGSTAQLRISVSQGFLNSSGVWIPASTSTNFYKTVTCTLASTTLTCPAFTLSSTTNGNPSTARYKFQFYGPGTTNTPRDVLFSNYQVPVILGATISIGQLVAFNQSTANPPRPGFPDIQQVQTLINSATGVVPAARIVTATSPIRIDGGASATLAADVTLSCPTCLSSASAVTSFNTRTGAVTPASNDYTWAQINLTTSSLANLTTRSAADLSSGKLALARLGDGGTPDTTTFLRGDNTWAAPIGQVISVFGRTGAVVAASNDYTFAQVGSKPTTLAGYGITDTLVNTFNGRSGTVVPATDDYTFAQVGGKPTTLVGYGITDAVPATRSLTAGAGLTGGGDLSDNRTFDVGAGAGITVNANDVALTTPGTVSVSSSNSSSGNHTHGVTSSSNPGAAAAILASDSGGQLSLVNLLATSNLFVRDTSTGFTSPGTTVVSPITGNAFRSPSYTSGLVGWNVNAAGDAEFNNIDVRGAIHSSVFVYNQLLATAGTLGVFKSACKLRTDATVPAGPTYGTTTINIDCVDQDGVSHATSQLFATNDVLRLKDGMTGDTWFTVASVSDQTTFWRYVATIRAGSNNVTYTTGAAVADYGPSGQGFIIQTADQANAPYMQMATHAATFTSADASGSLILTPKQRTGNLNGTHGYATNLFGMAAGPYGSAGATWVTVEETNGFRVGNNTTTLGQWDTSGNVLVGQTGAGQSNVYITAGAVDLRNDTTPRIHLAADGSGYLANSSISWTTGGDLTVAGNATIGGWSVGSDYIRSAADSVGLASTVTGGDDVRIWAGDTFANRNTAEFRVTEAGVATLTSALIGGWTVDSTSIRNAGSTVMLRGAGNLAFGSTPPTSATVGTGLFLDSTGMYGLASNVQQAKFDATTGAITAGAGNVTIDSSGITIAEGTGAANSIKWGDSNGRIYTDSAAGAFTVNVRASNALSGVGAANVLLEATGAPATITFALNSDAVSVVSYAYLNATGPSDGLSIGKTTAPAYKLDVVGDVNASGAFRVAGTVLAASHLSNGTTGSGSVVLATSPALTTPNLGTPSAIVLTNATGLPAFDDSTPVVKGSADPTKFLRIEIDGFTAGATRVVTMPDGNVTIPSNPIGGSTGGVDNRLIRADGAAGSTVQTTGIVVDDSVNLTGPASIQSALYKTTTNCADSAGAAACGSAAAGSVVIDAGATSVVVSTTAVTANSQIIVVFDSSLGTRLGVTCNVTAALPTVSARTAATSFTLTTAVAPITNPACYSYQIIN